MKKVLVFLLISTLFIGILPTFAAQGRKGASDRALERASDEAVFHRVGDWFATRGKTKEEKEAIIAERKTKRAATRAQKEAEKKKKMAEKQLRKKEKMMNKQANALKKGRAAK